MPPLKDPQRDSFCLAMARGESPAAAFHAIWPGANRNTVPVLASQMLKKPPIKARIAEIKNALSVRQIDYTANDVIKEMFKIGMANMDDFIEQVRDKDTGRVLETRLRSDIPKEKMAAVASITVEDTKNGQKTTIKLHDKRAALLDLGKHFNLFRDKVDVSVTAVNHIEVSTLQKDERELLKQILLVAKERKANIDAEAKMIEDKTAELAGLDVDDVEYEEVENDADPK